MARRWLKYMLVTFEAGLVIRFVLVSELVSSTWKGVLRPLGVGLVPRSRFLSPQKNCCYLVFWVENGS